MTTYARLNPLNARRKVYKWNLTDADAEGSVFTLPVDWKLTNVHIYGTFGGGTVAFKGSLDKSQFVTIQAINGGQISATAETIKVPVQDKMIAYKPVLTGSTGGDVNVVISIEPLK